MLNNPAEGARLVPLAALKTRRMSDRDGRIENSPKCNGANQATRDLLMATRTAVGYGKELRGPIR